MVRKFTKIQMQDSYMKFDVETKLHFWEKAKTIPDALKVFLEIFRTAL